MRLYKTLFEVDILHNYSKDEIFQEITLIPTDDTMNYIRGNKMLYKKTLRGFKVSYLATDAEGTPLISLDDYKFKFHFNVKDSGKFFNVTDLTTASSDGFKSGNLILFSNTTVDKKSLSMAIIDMLKPNEFTYNFPYKAQNINADTASLEILDFDDNSTQIISYSSVKPDKQGNYFVKVEIPSVNSRKYIFRISDSNNAQQDQTVLVDNILSKKKTHGIIEINYNSSSIEKYKVEFESKNSFWKYIIVNKSNTLDFSDSSLSVTDKSTGNIDPYKIYEFKTYDQPHPKIKIDNYETAVFKSKKKIPFYEVPKLNIQLSSNSNHGDNQQIELYEHLPNPNHSGIINENNESEIIVFI